MRIYLFPNYRFIPRGVQMKNTSSPIIKQVFGFLRIKVKYETRSLREVFHNIGNT